MKIRNIALTVLAFAMTLTPVYAGEIHGSHGDPIGVIIKNYQDQKKSSVKPVQNDLTSDHTETTQIAKLALSAAHDVKLAMFK
jgi:hypothetical protein